MSMKLFEITALRTLAPGIKSVNTSSQHCEPFPQEVLLSIQLIFQNVMNIHKTSWLASRLIWFLSRLFSYYLTKLRVLVPTNATLECLFVGVKAFTLKGICLLVKHQNVHVLLESEVMGFKYLLTTLLGKAEVWIPIRPQRIPSFLFPPMLLRVLMEARWRVWLA